MSLLTYPEAAVIGLLQGISELVPVSSLGHSVLIPALVGGRWSRDLSVTAPGSPYLAFIVGLHVATAFALILYFRADWVRIVRGLLTSVRDRKIENADQRLAWLLVVCTIPVGIAGLALDHVVRTQLAKPNPTAVFLLINGFVLIGAEQLRRRAGYSPTAEPDPHAPGAAVAADERISALPWGRALLIGAAQIAALLPGISRSGATMSAGLLRGLGHEDAARFSFLLATPVILAAGVLKLPDLAGSAGDGIRGQVLLGSVLSFIGAYLAVAFLTRFFKAGSLRPFGVYCLIAGAGSLVVLAAR